MRISILSCVVVLASCGSGGNGGGGDGGGGGFAGQCCLNGADYACPDQTSYQKCVGFDAAMCHAMCAVSDLACHMRCDQMAGSTTHDPSGCARNAAMDGQCSTSCMAKPSNPTCTVSGDCASNNCTGGHCYGSSVGDLCTVSGDCTSGNCTNGCCQGTSLGSPCTVSGQCDSGNCTNGKCQGNGLGSPCTVGGQCTSGVCNNGVCS